MIITQKIYLIMTGSGVTWHGACISFFTTDSNLPEGKRYSKQCQLPQTSHRILHNPYALFGLGRSVISHQIHIRTTKKNFQPNFVDQVNLGIPRWAEKEAPELQRHALSQIVPNSRIIVVPPQPNDPHWFSRLYVTPNRLIIISFIILASMCLFLLVLVAFLHYLEKRHDKKESMSQTRRFHFNVM